MVYQDSAVLIFFVNGMVGACFGTDGIFTVQTWDRQYTKVNIGEGAFLPLINAHPLNRARGDIMPLLAGNYAGITASAATQVNKETILWHYNSPVYFSAWTRFVAIAGAVQLSKSPPSNVDGEAPKSTPDSSGIYFPP